MNPLAIEWQCKPLGDICNIVGGGTPSKKNEAFFQGTIPWATVRDMNQNIITETSFKITEDAVKNSSTNIIKAGNVVIATRVGLGKVCLIDQDTAINQDLRGIIPKRKDTISVLFLYWWLKSIAHIIEQEGTGATVKGVKLPFVKSLKVPLPPLPEQQRIVSILDEVFEGIGKAVANVERNLENSRELFESYLNGVFTQKSDGWVEKRLSEILQVQPRNGWSPPARNHSDQGTPVLTLSSVTGFEFDISKYKYTSAPTKKEAHYWIKNGDFFISRSNTPKLVGHVAICSGVERPTIYPDLIMKMRLDRQVASTRFVYYQLRSGKLRELIMNSAQGANPTMKKINKGIVQGLPIVLPDLFQQRDIADKLDSLLNQTQHLETIYQKKLTALSELKQSILQKAFTGELTAKTVDKIMEPVQV